MNWHVFEIRRNVNQYYEFLINNRRIFLYISYCSFDDTWKISIYEGSIPLVCGLRVTLGYCNLDSYNVLSQYQHLNIGKLYFYNETLKTPNKDNLNKIVVNWVY